MEAALIAARCNMVGVGCAIDSGVVAGEGGQQICQRGDAVVG